MTIDTDRAAAPAQRRVRVEQTLARYPDVSSAEIADLLHWFRNEASAMDTAMIASDERLAQGYARFRADHLDRLGRGEQAATWMFGLLVAAAIAWFALVS